MKFHKGSFLVQLNYLCPRRLDYVSGWIDETNTYGFYKHNKNWKATDLKSGTRIITLPTRKGCAEWIESHQDEIAAVKQTQRYKTFVENFAIAAQGGE